MFPDKKHRPPLLCVPCYHYRRGPECKGNRLEWLPGSNREKLRLCFVHHKNESRWDFMPIKFELPPSLTRVLLPWLKQGHGIVTSRRQGQRLLLVKPGKAAGLSASDLSIWFNELQSLSEAPFRFPPNQLRHIFVDERCSEEAAAGPRNRGAARIMGNSEERWSLSYDRNLHQREVGAAVRAMEQWRSELLSLTE